MHRAVYVLRLRLIAGTHFAYAQRDGQADELVPRYGLPVTVSVTQAHLGLLEVGGLFVGQLIEESQPGAMNLPIIQFFVCNTSDLRPTDW